MTGPLASRYRRRGADPPFANPARDHRGAFEGYYWRFTDAARGRVAVALAGLTRSDAGRWALLALAMHPEGVVHVAKVPGAEGDPRQFGVRAGEAVAASSRRVRFALSADEGLDLEIEAGREWGRRSLGGSGLAQLVPGLAQYWHPYILGGRARGELRLAGRRFDLDGATVYAEKNWGSRFPQMWWWGQADAFGEPDCCLAFAGGPMRVAGLPMRPTLIAVRLGPRLVALAPPFARTRADVDESGWRLTARSPRYSIEIEGEDAGSAVALPVPVGGGEEVKYRSHQALAGRLAVILRRGRRTLFRGESRLAGLERPRP